MHRRLILLSLDARWYLTLAILAGLMVGFAVIGQAALISSIVDAVFLRDRGLPEVWGLMQRLLVIVAARGLLAWFQEGIASEVALRVKGNVRRRLFAHILALGPAYGSGERTGELATTAVEGVENLSAYFSQYLPQLALGVLVPLSVLAVVFPLDPLSGFVLLLTAPLIPFFMYLTGKGAEMATKRQYATLTRLASHFLDSLQGLATLKLFGQSKAHAHNIAVVSDQFRAATLRVMQASFLSAFALELVATISTAIIAVEVGLRLLYAQMQFREALFLLLLAPEFYLPLRLLGLRFHAAIAGTSAAQRIFQVLDTPLSGATPAHSAVSYLARTSAHGTAAHPVIGPVIIRFSDVTYTYPGAAKPALEHINLAIPTRTHVAIVGPSGAGKSTLASLLLGFIQPTSGRVTIDGAMPNAGPRENLLDLIAWVPQRPHLFHDTIEANIRVGRRDATDMQVAQAAGAAQLADLINSLPDRYDTIIAEEGSRLSSGEAQRLALARAFLKDAPILILDEPTSSLDPENEALLEASTQRLMQGRTVITIAHRLNTVFHADQIVVLQAGRVAESGTHGELLKHNGLYAGLATAGLRAWDAGALNATAHGAALGSGRRETMPAASARAIVRGNGVFPAQPGQYSRTASSTKSVFPRLLGFLRGSWGWMALSVLLGTLTIASSIALMGTSAWLISTAALHPSIAALQIAIVGVRFLGIARAVCRYLERMVSHSVTLRLLGTVRVWFYRSLEPLAPARLMTYRSGDLLARMVSDVETLENLYGRVLSPPLVAVCVGAGACIFLGLIDPTLAAILALSFGVVGGFLPLLAHVVGRRSGEELVKRRAELETQVVDGVQGLADVLAFGLGPRRIASLKLTEYRLAAAQRRMAWLNGFHSGLSIFHTNLALWLTLFIAIPLVISGRIDAVMLAPLALVTAASFEAVVSLPLAAQMWTVTHEAARRLFEIVDTEPAVRGELLTGAVLRRSCDRSAKQEAAASPPDVEVSDLTFAYPGTSTPVLSHVSFEIAAGGSLAIVGPSGAGKSCLASLLLRFWEYGSGDIRFGARSLRTWTPDEVRQQVGYVSQNSHFFDTSVYENLRLARRGVSRTEVEQAARDAQVHDFIQDLPQGYDTPIGERGLRLSAGERQRLALARALIKDAPVLILDEPTANLDGQTERQVLSVLFRVMHAKTTLLITHRLVGLEMLDQILVMRDGAIVERGSHGELLERAGLYRRLWDLQNRIWDEDI